jgi:WAS/WASL-interacting protein
VLPILLQQKARLEDRIAYVEKVELGGAEDNQNLPPSDSLARMDRASLQKMLFQVKAAIAARQAAAERARANASSENTPEGTAATAEPSPPPPVQSEWQRLVQAVFDAQQQAAQGRDGAALSGLHVVRAANTPSSPVLPNRRLLALLGVTGGLWTAILWAFARVVLGHARVKPTQYLPEGLPAFPLEGEVAVESAETTSASRLAAAKAVAPPTPTPTPPPAVAAATPATAPPAVLPETPALAKTDALPAFPMDADSAKAAAEATSAPRVAAVKATPPPPPPAKPAATPAQTPPAPAATVPAVEPPPAAEPKRDALPSFPMDAELAKAVDEATSASRAAPAKPVSETPSLPKVIIAPEATLAAEAKSRALPSFPMEAESAAAEKGLPVLVVDGARRTSVAPNAPVERAPYAAEPSPYAAVTEATRTGSVPPPPPAEPAPGAAAEAKRPSRHASWYTELPAAHASSRPAHATPHQGTPSEEPSIKPLPIAAVVGAKIEASPIMGIEEGMSTAASGKQGISVYPPPVAPVAQAAPGGTTRLGSVSPSDAGAAAAAGGSAHPGRRVTQMQGTPLGMNPSTSPSFGWTPPAAFGAHQMPRASEAPPGLVTIPPPPKPPSHIESVLVPIAPPTPTSTSISARSAPASAVQSHPLTPARAAAAVHVPAATVAAPSTALALARPRSPHTRSEPPAASSVVCDVPKGWAPHPNLIDIEGSEELSSLRDQLYRLAARESFVVGVSSGPEMAAYKSGVAGRLAWMLAQPGHARILLMEGDFDHPVVHRLMRIDMPIASGFSEQMRRRMNGSPPGPWTIVRCAPNLYVLAEGLVRSPGLLPTVQFADSVNELRRAYDLVVIDGPAGGMSVDTRALDAVADGIVLAGEADLLDRASSWFGKKQLMAVVSAGQAAPRAR